MKDSYLLELSRYVVLNPVRARMVDDAADWQWSSYRAMIGKADAPEWLQTDWLLAQFGRERESAVARYIDFVRAGVGLPSIWNALRGQVFLGSDVFVAQHQNSAGKLEVAEIPRAQRRPVAQPLEDYRNSGPDQHLAMANAYATGDYTMQEIARYFGVHYSTVSRASKRYAK